MGFDTNHLLKYLRTQNDYDATKQRPVEGPYVKHAVPPEDGEYLTRLEDIDESWVAKYVTDVIIGYKRNSGGVMDVKAVSNRNGMWTDSDGQSREITELESYSDSTTGYDLNAVKAKLPYLLRRVFQKSVQLRCSLISMYGRYLYLKYEGNTAPKPKDMLEGRIWRMDASGNITTPYTESANHNLEFPEAFKFVKGAYPQDPYYLDLLELGEVCNLLRVKLWREDPHDYDVNFDRKLLVTYVASNQDFLWAGQRRDTKVLSALKFVSAKDWAVQTDNVQSAVDAFLERCGQANNFHIFKRCETDLKSVRAFMNLYRIMTGSTAFAGQTQYNTAYGFICEYGTDTPFAFNTDMFCGEKGKWAILHKSGYFVRPSSTNRVYTLSMADARAYISAYNQGRPMEGSWGTWKLEDM